MEKEFEIMEGNREPQPEISFDEFRDTVELSGNRLVSVAEQSLNKIDKKEKESGVDLADLKEKIFVAAKRGLKALKLTSLLLLVGLGADFTTAPMFRTDVTKLMESGKIVYKHPDRETTSIIDYIAGKSDLPEDIKKDLLLYYVKTFYSGNNLKLPNNLKNFNYDELADFYISSLNQNIKFGLKINSEAKKTFFEKPRFGEKLYEYLWEVESRGGNPKIRWTTQASKAETLLITNYSTPFYFAPTNTLFIDPPTTFEDFQTQSSFFAESAHAIQRKNSVLKFDFKVLDAVFRTVYNSAKNKKSLTDEYDNLYKKPGSLEYEAHEEIEQKLKGDKPGRYWTGADGW